MLRVTVNRQTYLVWSLTFLDIEERRKQKERRKRVFFHCHLSFVAFLVVNTRFYTLPCRAVCLSDCWWVTIKSDFRITAPAQPSFLGSGPEGADDLCFHTGEISPPSPPPTSPPRPWDPNPSFKTQILASRLKS